MSLWQLIAKVPRFENWQSVVVEPYPNLVQATVDCPQKFDAQLAMRYEGLDGQMPLNFTMLKVTHSVGSFSFVASSILTIIFVLQ